MSDPRPPATPEYAKNLVQYLYNLEVIKVKELNGADDRNFYISSSDSKEFILKITNNEDTKETGLLGKIIDINK